MFDIPFHNGYRLTQNNDQIIGKKGKPLSLCKTQYHFYVNVFVNDRATILYLHRAIALVHHFDKYFEGAWVDHINDDPLDNRPENLRWVSSFENNHINKKIYKMTPKRRLLLKLGRIEHQMEKLAIEANVIRDQIKQL